jgi:hypothetical protein
MLGMIEEGPEILKNSQNKAISGKLTNSKQEGYKK